MRKSIIITLLLIQAISAQIVRNTDDIFTVKIKTDSTKEGYTFDKDYQIINTKTRAITTFCNLTTSDIFQLNNMYVLVVCDSTGCLYVEKQSPFEPTIIIRELEENMYNKGYVTYYRR